MRWPILIGILCHLTAAAGSGSLSIDLSVKEAGGGVWFGEIAADGQTLLRLRGGEEQLLRQRAADVAARLRRFAMEGIRPADIAVEPNSAGTAVTIGGRNLVVIDPPLAQLSGMSARSLAAAWARQLREVFSKAYLILEPSELLVPYGEVRTIGVGGTAEGQISCGLYADEIVEVTPAANGASVDVRGVGVGSTVASVERGGAGGVVTIDVRKWAAAIAESAEAVVTGGIPGNPALHSAVTNAALNAVRPEPGAVLRMGRPLRGASARTFVAPVEATGDGYIPAKRAMQVRVVNTAAPGLAAAALLVSNDPELISAPGDLMVGELPPSQAVRLLYHHKNAMSRPCRLVVALHNASEQPACVHITEAAAGPHGDELFVGHAATRRFAERLRLGHGYVVRIPGGYQSEVARQTLAPNDVASGLALLTNLGTGEVRITVSAESGSAHTGYFAPVPARVRGLAPGAGQRFQPEKRITASYTVGDAWLFLDIGREAVADQRGTTLKGNYGVSYQIKLRLHNARDESARAEIAVRAGGGTAWGSFSIDGHVVEMPLLMPGQERVLRTVTLSPHASRTVAIETMPEAASSYPVTLIVRSR